MQGRNAIFSLVQDNKYAFILILLWAVMYIPTLKYPFIWDDKSLIEENPFLEDFDNLKTVFSEGLLDSISDANRTFPWYRPISIATLLVEHQLFGKSPTGYHTIHALLHLISILMLYRLLIILSKTSSFSISAEDSAFWGTLVFATAPFSVDAVLFLSNIGDLIVLICALSLMMWVSRNSTEQAPVNPLYYRPVIFFISLVALFSKESGLAIPFVAGLAELFFRQNTGLKPILRSTISGILAMVVYGVTRHIAMPATPLSIDVTVFQTMPGHVLNALRWTLFPHPLAQMEPVSTSNPIVYWAILLVIVIGFVYWRRSNRIALTGAALWLVLISPVLFGLDALRIFSPRYLYVPFTGIVILFTEIHLHFRPIIRKLLLVVPASLLILSFIRIDAWHSPLSFWSLEYKRHPDNPMTLIHYSNAMKDAIDSEENPSLLLKAARIAKKNKLKKIESVAWRELGKYYQTRNDVETALSMYDHSLQVYPSTITWLRVGDIHATRRKDFNDALYAYQQAERLSPYRLEVLLAISDAYAGMQHFDMALKYIEKAEKLYRRNQYRSYKIQLQKNRILDYQKKVHIQYLRSKMNISR